MKRRSIVGPALLIAAAAGAASDQQNAAVPASPAGDGTAAQHRPQPGGRSLIFGSDPTQPGRHPYVAALLNQHGRPNCAGTLVAPDTILSAAHCADQPNEPASVIIGKHARSNYQNETDYEHFAVTRVIIHPFHRSGFNYINDHLLHDVVLIKFDGISRHTPIAVNFDNTIPRVSNSEEQLTVMGWGSINFNKDKPDVLMSANVSYIPNRICEEASGKIKQNNNGARKDYNEYITKDMLCASAPGRDSCSGDSGGPLIIEGKTPSEDVQVGVVSWGYGCASENFPGVCKYRLDLLD